MSMKIFVQQILRNTISKTKFVHYDSAELFETELLQNNGSHKMLQDFKYSATASWIYIKTR